MNILIACGDYYPNLGGVTSLYDNLAAKLRKSGHEVAVLSRQSPGHLEYEIWNECEIFRLRYPMLYEKLVIDREFVLRSPGMLWSVYKLLRKRRIETVCIGLLDMSAMYILLLRPILRFRLVVYLHGSDTRVLPKTEPSYRWILERALRSADAIVPVSQELAHEAAAFVPSASAKMQVITNGVDAAAIRASVPRPHPRPYITFVGRLVYEKDIDTLIEAFELAADRVEGVDLLIGGPGREEKRLRAKAAAFKHGDRIHFLGKLPRSECYSLVKGALFKVLPSRTEGNPIVAIEARVAGTPLIGSRIPGIARIVEEGRTGVLFTRGDAAELAALMERYCGDRAALARLSEGTRTADSAGYDIADLLPKHLAALGVPA